MAYNMSPYFLAANRDLVEDLIKAADNSEVLTFVSDNPHELERLRQRINNLLASLIAWHPERKYVRQVIRTWVKQEGKQRLLFVGVPSTGIKGRRPSVIDASKAEAVQATLTISEPITPENVSQILMKLATAKLEPGVITIVIEEPPEQSGIEYLEDKLSPEFKLVQRDPHLRFTRPQT